MREFLKRAFLRISYMCYLTMVDHENSKEINNGIFRCYLLLGYVGYLTIHERRTRTLQMHSLRCRIFNYAWCSFVTDTNLLLQTNISCWRGNNITDKSTIMIRVINGFLPPVFP
jgi:hypothetical protein